LAEAVQRRISAQEPRKISPAEEAAEHARRQKFRRLIDPGILRPNPENQALESLKILYKLSDNLLREPDNPKFQRFKTTNAQIQKHVMEPKGTVEFLRELGFHPEVRHVIIEPFFVFNPKRLSDLKLGSAMLKESLDIQEEKRARASVAKQTVQEARAEVLEKVQLAFIEDRKSKMEADERDRQARAARAERIGRGEPAVPVTVQRETGSGEDDGEDEGEGEGFRATGSGDVLGSAADQPPPYHDDQ
ncbi:hypothetical protein BDP27DRAFT_1211500, partial [Rhodocollybia butyracea]